MRTISLATFLCVFCAGCQTLPNDAPKELHEADNALKKMHQEDMDKVMPISAKKADETFASAIDLWKDNKSSAERNQSIKEAVEAKKLAEDVTQVGVTLKKWDNNIKEYENTMAMVNEVKSLREQVAKLQSGAKEAESPFAMLKNVSLIAPVAFFDFNKAEVSQDYHQDLSSLGEMMKLQNRLTMALTGYADSRGNTDYNKRLAMERARNVAAQLEKMGVSADRITVFSGGPVEERTDRRTISRYQLDRKVVATLGFR